MGYAQSFYFPTHKPKHTRAGIQQLRDLVWQRAMNCPRTRYFHKYIKVDPAGSASGGGAAGTLADPYLVRHWNDCVTLITAIQSDNMQVSLKGGDTFYDTTGTVGNLNITVSNFTLDSYGTGDAIITCFQLESTWEAGAWTLAAAGRYTKTFATVNNTGAAKFTCVRLNAAMSNLEAGTETVFTRCTSTAAVEASTYGFWFQTSGAQTIVHCKNNGTTPAGNIQISRGDGNTCITVYRGDRNRVQGLLMVGHAIQQADNGRSALVIDIGDNNECFVEDCGFYYAGSGHVSLSINSLAGHAGGYLTYHKCHAGLMNNPASGEGKLLTGYNGSGAHELICSECVFPYGTIPDAGQLARRGAPYYAHSSAETVSGGFYLAIGCTTRSHTYGCKNPGTFASTPPYTTSVWHTAEYRAFIVQDTFEGGDGTSIDMNSPYICYINCDWKWRPDSTLNWLFSCFYAPSSVSRKNIYFNCVFQLDLATWPGAAGTFRAYTGGSKDIDSISTTAGDGKVTVHTTAAHYLTVGAYVYLTLTNSTPACDGFFVVTDITDAQTYKIVKAGITVAGTSGKHNPAEPQTFIHCHFRAYDSLGANTTNFAWCEAPTNSTQAVFKRWWNCIFSIESNNANRVQSFGINGTPSTSMVDNATGGMSGCAFWSATTQQKATNVANGYGYDNSENFHDNTTSPALGAAPTPFAAPSSGALFQTGSTNCPIELDYDFYFQPRNIAKPSKGPVEPVASIAATTRIGPKMAGLFLGGSV